MAVAHGDTSVVAMRLRDLREARHMTQEDVAERAGVKQSQVSAWERGPRRPSLANVRGLARAFKMPDEALARELGYLDPTNGAEDAAVADGLPPGIVALIRAILRREPGLAWQLERDQDLPDFNARVEGIAKVLGIVARGLLDEGES